MFTIKTVDELYDLIGYVILSAPDEFPVEDYLEDHEQMTLELAFELLRKGVEIAYPEPKWLARKNGLNGLLEQSLTAFKVNDGKRARKLLYDFQNKIFKQNEYQDAVNNT